MKNLKLYEKLLKKNKQAYVMKICEELSELQTAVLHYLDNKAGYFAVVEEIADVQIQLEKVMVLLNNDDVQNDVLRIYVSKSEQLERICNG